MLLRKLLRAGLFLAGLAIVTLVTACAQTQSAPAMVLAHRADVAAYFANHPYKVPDDWRRGVLISSQKNSYACLDGECWTWSGTVITPDGNTVTLQSVEGEAGVYDIVSVGDDFIWTKDPHPSYTDEVKVIKYAAVSATDRPTPSVKPTASSTN